MAWYDSDENVTTVRWVGALGGALLGIWLGYGIGRTGGAILFGAIFAGVGAVALPIVAMAGPYAIGAIVVLGILLFRWVGGITLITNLWGR
jgi:hypothetical protein